MNGRFFSFGSSGSPLAQFLSLIVFGVVLVVAVIMGAVVLAALIGLALIGFLALTLRAWWLRRSGGRGPNGGSGPGRPGKSIRYIEGEYEIIDADADADEDAARRRSGERR